MNTQPESGNNPVEVVTFESVKDRAVPGEEHSLGAYAQTVIDARWVVLGTTIAATILGGLYYLAATPVYYSDTLVQVEERKSPLTGLDESKDAANASPADTEIEILRSRALLGAVVDELHLDVVAEPRFVPVVGRAVASTWAADRPANPALGLSAYAWGGERIRVGGLEVPKRWEEKPLRLVARPKGRYELRDPDGALVGSGEIGITLAAGELRLLVTELVARDGTEFEVTKLPRVNVIQKLQRDLGISERGKRTGILQVELTGPEPGRLAAILDSVARAYQRQNVERKSAEVEKILAFIDSQLPTLRQSVDAAEAALNDYRSKVGSMDVTLETRAILERSVQVERELSGLELQVSDARQHFTDNHPAVATARQKLATLRAERDELATRIKRLPEAEMQSARRLRDAKVANELYVLLLNKAQELRVMKSGAIGNVRILDAALVPRDPIAPKARVTLGLSALLGLALGLTAAFARGAFARGVDDPDVIERQTGVPIYASIPHSPAQVEASRNPWAREAGADVLATTQPGDPAIEALRSLRTSIQFALSGAGNNVVAISGPSPDVGKSFTCVNLAHVFAQAGFRVLIVDADLRKGLLHEYFDTKAAPGLSDLIRGTVPYREAVRKTPVENLDFIPTGGQPQNPSELLSSEDFRDVVARAASYYDVVLVDTSPILSVADAVLASRVAGMSLVVLRAGRHPIREITACVQEMNRKGLSPRGFILNDVKPSVRYGNYNHL